LHDALLKHDPFFKRITDHLVIPIVFLVGSPSNFLGSLWLRKLNRSSGILEKSESGKGYFFFLSSFSIRHLLVVSLKGALLLSSSLGFYVIRIGMLVKMNIASLVELLEN